VLGADGAPYLGLLAVTSTGSYDVHAAKWTGTTWQYFGTAANGAAHVGTATTAIAVVNDVPHVAWYEHTGTGNHILVKRWSGSAWQAVGAPVRFVPNASTGDPALAVGAGGLLHLAFSEYDSNTETVADYAARFVSGAFTPFGTGYNRIHDLPTRTAMGSTTPAVAIDGSGRVVMVSKVMDTGHPAFVVRRFDGTTWRALGENLTAYRGVRKVERLPTLALTPKGRALVAFTQSDGTSTFVHIYRSNL
jgi:hypothetical protein